MNQAQQTTRVSQTVPPQDSTPQIQRALENLARVVSEGQMQIEDHIKALQPVCIPQPPETKQENPAGTQTGAGAPPSQILQHIEYITEMAEAAQRRLSQVKYIIQI